LEGSATLHYPDRVAERMGQRRRDGEGDVTAGPHVPREVQRTLFTGVTHVLSAMEKGFAV